MNLGVLDPQGPVAAAQRTILGNSVAIMLAVIVPVALLTLGFAWWFRAGNPRAQRRPDWTYSGAVEVTVWSIPLLVIVFLGGIAWLGSHQLDPMRPLDGGGDPFEVQVVSLDWKWLFIYPQQGTASVNRLVVPAGVPLRFKLTSATVMNSFLVPQLGSQIYAMSGMATTLHLKADRPGIYPGLSAQFSGDGFSDMRFDVVALAPQAFAAWQAEARAGHATLDAAAYDALSAPGTQVPEATFARVEPGLFQRVLDTFMAVPAAVAPSGPSASGAAVARTMRMPKPMPKSMAMPTSQPAASAAR